LPGATIRDLHDAFTMSDPETGFESRIDTVDYSPDSGKIMVAGQVWRGADDVGAFMRVFRPDGTVYHESFALRDLQQNKGFGAKFYRHAEETYLRMGVKSVRLNANAEVGGYAWARMGFDFADDDARERLVSHAAGAWFTHMTGSAARTPPMPKVAHAWELAALTTPDGTRIGKSVMLGSAWPAVKHLTPRAPGLKVGRDYYAAKERKT
jgi:GNAT superfamily N-acetyltransferase